MRFPKSDCPDLTILKKTLPWWTTRYTSLVFILMLDILCGLRCSFIAVDLRTSSEKSHRLNMLPMVALSVFHTNDLITSYSCRSYSCTLYLQASTRVLRAPHYANIEWHFGRAFPAYMATLSEKIHDTLDGRSQNRSRFESSAAVRIMHATIRLRISRRSPAVYSSQVSAPHKDSAH
jgi:hypothetical protein